MFLSVLTELEKCEKKMRKLFYGEKVKLSHFHEEDFAILEAEQWDSEVVRNLAYDALNVYTAEDWQTACQSERDKSFNFAIRKLDDSFLGYVFLDEIQLKNRAAELGIGIFGQGYGKEALALVLDFAFFDLNLHRVNLTVNANNPAAIKAYEACGFVREGTARAAVFQDGKWLDQYNYGILANEWTARR